VTLDQDWVKLFKLFDVQVCLSIDGAKEIHDKYRPDLLGKGTYDRTVAAINLLRSDGIEPTVISVCDPTSDPKLLLATLVDELKLNSIDILIPDANHETGAQSIANYYKRLADLWFDEYAAKKVRIKILDNMICGTLGLQSITQSVGLGQVETVILNPGGELEPLDILRIAGHSETTTDVNVFENSLQDIIKNEKWQFIYHTSDHLAEECQHCKLKQACGAGDLTQRWSSENRYDNVSVYCEDFKEIFQHLSKLLNKRAEYLKERVVND